jgi:hypothetical protein
MLPLCTSLPSICFLSILPFNRERGDFIRQKRKEREQGGEKERETEREIERV